MKVFTKEADLMNGIPRTLQARAGLQLRNEVEKLGGKIGKVDAREGYLAIDLDLRGVRAQDRELLFELLHVESALAEPLDVPAYLHPSDRNSPIEAAARGLLRSRQPEPLPVDEIGPMLSDLALRASFSNLRDGSSGHDAATERNIAAEIERAGFTLPPEVPWLSTDELRAQQNAADEKQWEDEQFVAEQTAHQREILDQHARDLFFNGGTR
jgi:hypothetical protein